MIQITISKKTALLLIVGALLVVPVTAAATHVFGDVADDNIHADGIGWVKDAGVTQGCGGGDYCPKDPVTREQMATFMYRLSGNDAATEPSVVAKSAANIHTATVLENGTVVSGTATGVDVVANAFANVDGFQVIFGQEDLRDCTATVTEGVNGSGIGQSQGQVQDASPYAIAGWPFQNVVRVVWDVGLGGQVDVDFHLVVVCP